MGKKTTGKSRVCCHWTKAKAIVKEKMHKWAIGIFGVLENVLKLDCYSDCMIL